MPIKDGIYTVEVNKNFVRGNDVLGDEEHGIINTVADWYIRGLKEEFDHLYWNDFLCDGKIDELKEFLELNEKE